MYTLTPPAFVTTTTSLTRAIPSVTPIVSVPLAPGTRSNCEAYVEHMPVDPYRDQSESQDVRLGTEHMNSCDFAASAYPISLDDFLAWNPSLASINPCYLQPGYSYCALNSSTAIGECHPDPRSMTKSEGNTKGMSYDLVSNPSRSLCLDHEAVYPGTVPTCSCFTTVLGAEANCKSQFCNRYPSCHLHRILVSLKSANKSVPLITDVTCALVAEDAKVKVADLITWNPWVGSNCDEGLFAGLTGTQERAVCIGVESTGTSSTATSGATTTATVPSVPTQTGIVAGCTKYYTAQLGDGCWAISNQFDITLEQFYAWNPAGKSNLILFFPFSYPSFPCHVPRPNGAIHDRYDELNQLTVPCLLTD
jgi:hypothetical protein